MDFRSWLEWAGPSRGKRALVWFAGFVVLVYWLADFLERVRSAPDNAISLGAQLMSVLADTSFTAWLVLLVGVLCLAVATFDLWRPLLHHSPLPQSEPVGTKTALAQLHWKEGLRGSRVDLPWGLQVRIEIQASGNASCYARWGSLTYYMSGKKAWDWSPQVEIMPPQMVSPGKVLDYEFASIEPGSYEMAILGGKASGHIHHEELICCEIVVAVGDKLQRERRHYGLVAGRERLIAVLIDESRFDGVGDTQ